MLAPPRGFSQRATSFIASQCQGIHQMPFFALEPKPNPSRASLQARTGSVRLRQLSTSSQRSVRRAISDNAKPGQRNATPPDPLESRPVDPASRRQFRVPERPVHEPTAVPIHNVKQQPQGPGCRNIPHPIQALIPDGVFLGLAGSSRHTNPRAARPRVCFEPRRLEPPHQTRFGRAACRPTLSGLASCRPPTQEARPRGYRASALVELTGIEPVTPCLQSRCSPS